VDLPGTGLLEDLRHARQGFLDPELLAHSLPRSLPQLAAPLRVGQEGSQGERVLLDLPVLVARWEQDAVVGTQELSLPSDVGAHDGQLHGGGFVERDRDAFPAGGQEEHVARRHDVPHLVRGDCAEEANPVAEGVVPKEPFEPRPLFTIASHHGVEPHAFPRERQQGPGEYARLLLGAQPCGVEHDRLALLHSPHPAQTGARLGPRGPLLDVHPRTDHLEALRVGAARPHPPLEMPRVHQGPVEAALHRHRVARVASVPPALLLDVAEIDVGGLRTVTAEIRENEVAELALREQHDLGSSRLDEVSQIPRMVVGLEEVVEHVEVGGMLRELRAPGVVARERRGDRHLVAPLGEPADQLEIETIGATQGEPRHDHQDARISVCEPVGTGQLVRDRIEGGGAGRRQAREPARVQMRIARSERLAEGHLPLGVLPAGRRIPAPEPVEILRDRRTPEPAVRAAEPQVPVLEAVDEVLVEASDCFEHLLADQRPPAGEVLFQEASAVFEALAPEVLLGSEADGPRVHEGELGVRGEAPQALLEGRGLEEVVLIEQVDEAAACSCPAGVACCAAASVALVVEDPDARIAAVQALEDRFGLRVRAAVDDDDPFPLLEGLVHQAPNRLVEAGARPMERSHHGDCGFGADSHGPVPDTRAPCCRRGGEVGIEGVDHWSRAVTGPAGQPGQR
jgi:hypothetical protein